jgi:hypothetical protein
MLSVNTNSSAASENAKYYAVVYERVMLLLYLDFHETGAPQKYGIYIRKF